ncbi:uncharacterized protein LOC125653974 isoform X2 [Ostrea edulis]|nr:uncharacterized protein LOC125653974 isoform X2 [Ostrea edulis]
MLSSVVFIWIIGANLLFCSACLNTYTILGPGFGGSHIYFSGNNTLDECQTLCNNDTICLGYEYEASISFCQLSNNNTGQATGNGTSYFYKRNCCLNSYTSIGNRRRASSGSTLWESSPLSRPDCENQCNSYTTCMGFYYNTDDSTCGLSSSSSYSDDYWCSSCHYYVKQCPGGCFTTYTTHGPNKRGVGVFYEETPKTKVECEALCNADEICQGFHHNTDDDLCQLTVANNAISASTSIFSSCNECFFYQRHCPKGCFDAYTVVGPYRKSSAVYWENTLTVEDCEASCKADSFCEGFTYRTDNSLCQLATSNNEQFTFCSSCYFHKRQCSVEVSPVASSTATTDPGTLSTNTEPSQKTESSLLSITTQTETTVSEITTVFETTTYAISTSTDTLKSSTAVEVVVNSSVQCTCVCVEVNTTLEESIEQRKRELQVNVDELSSTKRKLTSADDPRPSARTVGYVGIAFFALLGSFIVIPDFFSVVVFIVRRLKLLKGYD